MDRHGRQIRLAEIGSAGQDRIRAATVDVHGDGLAAEVAARYLAGAGVGCVRVRQASLESIVRAIDENVRVELQQELANGEVELQQELANGEVELQQELANGKVELQQELANGKVSRGSGEVAQAREAHDFRDPVARDFAAGARAALRELRARLEGAS